ncbi:hypothetical protein LPJ53_004040 [Coemansia erecta]|uniref:EF-hand n=1 Tax=Coemansia erecta TaxID=147472 RepID=A0A9W7XYU6_9FUNG|nr:hypothetical protein LPJ53_004040 [Coemansia erecta]
MDTIRDNTGSLAGLWRPTEREQKAYTYMLSLVDTHKEGIVRGQQAVPFFQKSGLPDAALGNIWQQADADSKGHLTAHEFGVAMKLISLAQAHRTADLRSLKDDAQLPDLKGVDLSRFTGAAGALPPSIGSMASATFTYGSGTHGRRDSNTSSVGWANAMGGGAPAADDSDAVISAKEKQQYQQLFEKSGPVDGAISGAAARALFTKSKLSNEQLGSVWSLGDPHGEGKLRLPGFLVAMYYIRRIMENRSYVLPKACPVGLWRSAGGDIPLRATLGGNFSQSSLLGGGSTADLTFGGAGAGTVQWDVTPEERVQYEQYFNNLDADKAGYLTGEVPVNFFLKSKLSEVVLSKVWDLADINRNGRMTKDEFAVAMHLINARLAGTPVPDTLPPTLVPPSMRRAAMTSSSMHNLSPPLRPSSARDRLQIDSLKRATSYAVRTPNPAGISRTAMSRSPGPLSPVADDSEVHALQTQLGQMEDMSRGLQAQRTAAANGIALAGSRRQELEVKISALQSSHDAESRINQELQEKLKAEEARVAALQAQVGEASRTLTVVSAQRAQLEQDVHRVQTQQLALQQKLRQAQDDAKQLAAEIAALDQQKKHLEQTIMVTESQIKQQEEASKLLTLNAEALKAEVDDLTQTQTQLQSQSQSLAQSLSTSQARSAADMEAPSFDDVFGTTGESPVYSPNDASFGDMFQSMSLPPTQPIAAEISKSPATTASSIPITSQKSQQQQQTQAASPSSVFATMPSFGPSQTATSANAFDSFGAHEKDPFEEFLQAAASPNPEKQQQQQASGVGSFDAIFGEAASASRGASADPRSVSSTPAPSSAAYAAVTAAAAANGTPSPALPSSSFAKSTPASPQAIAKTDSATQPLDFAADFSSAFGMMPGANERAIKKDIEEFDAHFPDINTLSLAEENAQEAATAATMLAAQNAADEDLTFESVFGTGEQAAGKEPATSNNAGTAAGEAAKSAKDDGTKPEEAAKSARKDSSSSEDDAYDDGFVPPPVVKRTNVGVRPMSRVLSIFRSSSSNRTSSMTGGSSAPAMPRRATASEKRQQMSRDQDKKFEEQWAKGDWPDWVRKGEHTYERRTLIEMGYPKDRVVEALEVNDFNLAQATDYLLSS